MGIVYEIKKLKSNPNKSIVKIEMANDEIKNLKANYEEVYVFSKDSLSFDSKLVKRGSRENTKYFLLNKKLREGLSPTTDVKAGKFEKENEIYIVFCIKKTFDETIFNKYKR